MKIMFPQTLQFRFYFLNVRVCLLGRERERVKVQSQILHLPLCVYSDLLTCTGNRSNSDGSYIIGSENIKQNLSS